MAESKQGKFIVFEGLDGSGKSTQIALLAQRLRQKGRTVSCTAEPTSSATGGLIRDSLSGCTRRGAAELAALFLTDRVAHNQNPVWGFGRELDAGTDVICDRYYYSSFAYQGMGTDLQWVMDANLNCPDIRRPDLCIFLDVDYRKCKQRLDAGRAYLEIYETDLQVMENTRKLFFRVFELLKDRENIRIVDADRPPEQVADEIVQIYLSL